MRTWPIVAVSDLRRVFRPVNPQSALVFCEVVMMAAAEKFRLDPEALASSAAHVTVEALQPTADSSVGSA
jgi:hypothetical protein